MSGLVWRISKNYFDRKKGKNVKPMLSVYDDQNEEFISELAEMDEKEVTHTAESEEAAASEQAPAENE